MVRVRIAPSPTGIPHIGNTRTAMFNYLFAKHHNGKFLLRIEDTDQARLVPESEGAIREILTWLGLVWDEEYKQSDRKNIYQEYADMLKKQELAYEDSGALRFNMQKDGQTMWDDAIGNKHIVFENKTQEDFVIIKSDGFPTYNFANVIDDHIMDITHVIRGEEFISSTPKHVQLYKAFGWNMPIFAHLPVILGSDHQKLSKRHGAKSAIDYRNEGYLKEALLNYMALLGWNPGGDKEIMTMEEMIDAFDLKDVNTASPIFDIKKLIWMNGVYIRQTQSAKLKAQIVALASLRSGQNSKLKNVDEDILDKLIPLAQTRMETLNDFYSLTSYFFEPPTIQLSDNEKEIARQLAKSFSTMKQFDNETILATLKQILVDNNIRMGVLYKILTGTETGLPLPQSLAILGKDETIKRLQV